MSDFNPVTIYFILAESMGVWLWLLLGLALVLLAGIVTAAMRLRRARRSPRRPLAAAIGIGAVTTIAFAFLVPAWTLTGPAALSAPVDYAAAVLFALVPGAGVGALVFFLAASRCAAGGAAQVSA